MTCGMFTTSCKDMLSPDSERHSYEVANDTLYSYWGIVKSLQNIAERYVILNECRADLVDGTNYVSDTIAAIINFGQNGYADKYRDGQCAYLRISDYYHVINSCNAYIAMCDTALQTATKQPYMMKEYSQVMAIRAWVYMQLVYAYGEVPFYTNPMLTTDAINKFMADKNHPVANASNLADLLAPSLEPMYAIEEQYGFPQYNNYGDVSSSDGNYVCHSTKCMFPVSIVLGDLYLMKGDKASCQKAAQHYYNYINTKYCGPINPDHYYSAGDVIEGEDNPIYNHSGTPWTERAAVSKTTEAITCIPSNKGRLDGTVNTDICRLFGFEASIRQNGSGDNSSASVSLQRQYERELIPSRGYEALCDSQKYECYLGDAEKPYMELVELPGVGDARRSWIYQQGGEQFTFRVGDERLYGKMVTKQNPNEAFTTVYPMVYRKATVWLHYAEALNRAGFPSYAFAILKTGLCNNENWFPSIPTEGITSNKFSYVGVNDYFPDYQIKDTLYVYQANDTTILPIDWKGEGKCGKIDDLKALAEAYYQHVADSINAANPEEEPVEPTKFDPKKVSYYAASYSNTPSITSPAACYYLSKKEVEAAASTPWLNFSHTMYYLRGVYGDQSPAYKTDIYSRSKRSFSWPMTPVAEETIAMGIHYRGCGSVRYDDPDRLSLYNYVKLVQKNIKDNHGVELTEDDIYSGQYEEWVEDAVEDLILTECAMELAFEGSRFSDLCRVSLRRNDPTYLAKRVAMRSGQMDMNLYNFLSATPKNWYLPFPVE